MRIASEAVVLDLVDGIYEAGIEFASWPHVLERIADVFGARDAALGQIGPPGLAWMIAPRTDPDYLRAYPENFHSINDVWHGISQRGVGAATTDDMVISRPQFLKSTYYNEWARPQEYRTVIGGVIDIEDDWRTVLMLPGRDPYGADATRLFGTLSPHIRRAVQLNRRLARTDLEAETLGKLVRRLPGPALMVDAAARVLAMNDAAEVLVTSGQGLHLTRRTLQATDNERCIALHRMIAHCARSGVIDSGGSITVTTESNVPLMLSLIPLRRHWSIVAPELPAALIVRAADPAPRDVAQQLRLKYRLTAAESAFAIEIIKGDGKRAAAERCGISYSTARTHLSRIFEKTGVRRQAALVRLLASQEDADAEITACR